MKPSAENLSVAPSLVACAECQRQKSKCDKKVPCGSCKRRGCGDICPTGTLLSTGRGKRSIMSHVPNLNSTIVNMGQRIRDLEEALACTQESTKSSHALWSKCVLSAPLRTESTPAPSGDTLGSFVVDEHGETVYYGPVGGFEVFRSFHSASKIIPPGRDGQLFTALTTSFPFSSSAERPPSWNPTMSLDHLVIFVPSRTRAHNLCELYFHNAAWHGTPLTHPEVTSLRTLIYTRRNPSLPLEITPHQLACVFLIFALGSIVDTAVSGVDSADGDCYFGLASAALSVKNVFDFEEPELATVQAFTLLANYYTYISRRFSVETAWQTISMASSLAQRLGLHRESCVSKFPPPLADRCRGLFWELYACENIYVRTRSGFLSDCFPLSTMQGLAVGRPVSIRPESISCAFPPEEEQEEEGTESAPFGKPLPGYRHARWKFVQDIMAPVMETFLAIKKPSYETILKFDLRIRKFIQTSLPPLEAIDLSETDPPRKFLHRGSLRVLANQVLIFIHRDSFVEAMRISPTNPLQSPYSSSFLAAYRSAAEIVKANNRDCKRYPELLPRWYVRTSNALPHVLQSLHKPDRNIGGVGPGETIIVATVAIRYPNSDMKSEAHFSQVIADLLETVDILDRVAGDCANHIGFGIFRNAIEKALALHSRHTDSQNQLQTRGFSLERPHASVRASDKPLNPAQCMAAEDLERELKLLEQAATSLALESDTGTVGTTNGMAEHDPSLQAPNQTTSSSATAFIDMTGPGYRDNLLFLPAELESLSALSAYSDLISDGFNARSGIGISSADARLWDDFLGSL